MAVFWFSLLFVASGLVSACIVAYRLRRLSSKSCTALINDMRYVNFAEVCRVSKALSPAGKLDLPTPREQLETLGGLEGLQRLRHNAEAMMDIARYLTLMNPDACEIAHLIRKDAARVRRTATTLYWQQTLHQSLLLSPSSIVALARAYVAMSINMIPLYEALVVQVVPLMQEIRNTRERIMRTGNGVSETHFA